MNLNGFIKTSVPERFDGNQVEFTGKVTKIWSKTNGDVYARVAISDKPNVSDEEPVEDDNANARLTLKFPNGQFNTQDISLLKGDILHVTGYLSDATQMETLRDFLLKARQPDLIEKIPELAVAVDVQVKRAITYVIPERLELVTNDKGIIPDTNAAKLEGVVARVWEYGGHLFIRMAVYDRHTTTTGELGNNGRQRRVPHYITVQFTHQQVDGRAVSLKPKDRIRVTGALNGRLYSENLRSFLISARKADLLANLSDGNAPDEVWTSYAQTCLVAQTLIVYTKK